jgi:hypothetical protein
VRFDSTGVEKGFMIFFTATGWLVNWSFAELQLYQLLSLLFDSFNYAIPDQPEGPHAHGLQISVPAMYVRQASFMVILLQPNLLVISKVVPKICARTNSAIFAGGIGIWIGLVR